MRYGVALIATVLTFLLLAIATDIIPNPLFGRDVPVRPWELPVAALTALLTGAWFGLQRKGAEIKLTSLGPGPLLAFFAIACPVCNKLVLLALGTSGALGLWAPLQPYLAVVSLLLLVGAVGWAWYRRPCADEACSA